MAGLRQPDYALSECVGAEKSQFDCWFFNWLINLADKLLMTMSTSLAPPSPGGSRAFTLAAWNIRCGRNAGLTSAAKGLAQMGVGLAILTETKITDDRYTRLASGYKILASKAASHNQGGIALLWRENHQGSVVVGAEDVLRRRLMHLDLTAELFCSSLESSGHGGMHRLGA